LRCAVALFACQLVAFHYPVQSAEPACISKQSHLVLPKIKIRRTYWECPDKDEGAGLMACVRRVVPVDDDLEQRVNLLSERATRLLGEVSRCRIVKVQSHVLILSERTHVGAIRIEREVG
jgi:hypothetical protein